MPSLIWPAAIWIFVAACVAHNLEEAIWLPGFRDFSSWSRGSPLVFRFTVGGVTMIVIGAGVAAMIGGADSAGAYAMCGIALAMGVNALAPHVALSIWALRAMPGLLTGCLLVLPSAALLIGKALGDGYIRYEYFAFAGPGVALALLASLPPLFWMGRKIEERWI